MLGAGSLISAVAEWVLVNLLKQTPSSGFPIKSGMTLFDISEEGTTYECTLTLSTCLSHGSVLYMLKAMHQRNDATRDLPILL